VLAPNPTLAAAYGGLALLILILTSGFAIVKGACALCAWVVLGCCLPDIRPEQSATLSMFCVLLRGVCRQHPALLDLGLLDQPGEWCEPWTLPPPWCLCSAALNLTSPHPRIVTLCALQFAYAMRAVVVNEFTGPDWSQRMPGLVKGASTLGEAALLSFDFATDRSWVANGIIFL
jgi:hypothetical protein